MSPKEIAEEILLPDSDFPAWEDIEVLANAYLELEKKNLSLTQAVENYHAQLNRWDRERIDAGYEQIIFELKGENEKLKKSREVLRSAFEVIARGESQFDNVDHMYTAREALKADSEIMEGK